MTVATNASSTSLDRAETARQEAEYDVPYHHIPVVTDEGLKDYWYWSWGVRYLAGLDAVSKQLDAVEWTSIRDLGCGDGRFVRELRRRFPDRIIDGVDVSAKALAWARVFDGAARFEERDIVTTPPAEPVDVITLVEVLEHIEPSQLPGFVAKAAEELRPGGWAIVTVPHKNVRTTPKHYQHFNSETLTAALSDSFDVQKVMFMDKPSRLFRWWMKALGGEGHNFLITNPKMRKQLYDFYFRNCQFSDDEQRCKRLLVVAKRK